MRRPGPLRVDPGSAPGGVVIHVYALDGSLLLDQRLAQGVDVPHLAAAGAAHIIDMTTRGEAVVLVAYDGDTGDRYARADLRHPKVRPRRR